MPNYIKPLLFASIFLMFGIPVQPLLAEDRAVINAEAVSVIFEKPLESAARQIAETYPDLKQELQKIFHWPLTFRSTVILIKNNQQFQNTAGTDLVVAFAVPEKNLIVVDYSKMSQAPFHLTAILKHEMCHLLLHAYIGNDYLPRWLDEGVCQWASDGITEVIMDNQNAVLQQAALSGRYLRMDDLNDRFPKDKESLRLAYAQSKSFVDYLDQEFGRSGILNLLESLRRDTDIETAVEQNFAISLNRLEAEWIDNLRTKNTWLTFVSTHIYEIIFFLGALALIAGFVRNRFRQRAYQDEREADD